MNTALVSSIVSSTSRPQVADRIVRAYELYAKVAVSCGVKPPTKVNTGQLKKKLRQSMQRNASHPSVAARDWASAFESYWIGALFGTGTVTTILGTAALRAALTAIWVSGRGQQTPQVATKIANALDAFTRTVTVSDPAALPSGCVGPII
jgi:hypothetical protein